MEYFNNPYPHRRLRLCFHPFQIQSGSGTIPDEVTTKFQPLAETTCEIELSDRSYNKFQHLRDYLPPL